MITKDGKVSCECCETYCCMYDPLKYGDNFFTYDDFPSEALFESKNLLGTTEFSVIIDKVPPGSVTTPFFNRDALYYKEFSNPFPAPNNEGTAKIYIAVRMTSIPVYEYYIEAGSLGYLYIGGVLCFGQKDVFFSGDPFSLNFYNAFSDAFASSFNVSGPRSGIVIREEKWDKTVEEYIEEIQNYNEGDPFPTEPTTICRWIGGGIILSWNTTTCKWQVNGNNKSGFQNTPVGSYAGGYSVS